MVVEVALICNRYVPAAVRGAGVGVGLGKGVGVGVGLGGVPPPPQDDRSSTLAIMNMPSDLAAA